MEGQLWRPQRNTQNPAGTDFAYDKQEKHPENKRIRKTYKYLIYISCLCLLLAIGAMTAVSLMSVQSVRKLVRNTTTKSITELTVSKAQFLDEKIHSELLSLQSFAANLGAFDDLFAYPELLEDYKEKHGAARMWIIDTNGTYQDTGDE